MNKKMFGAVVLLLALFSACDMTGSKSEWSSGGKAVVRVVIGTAGIQGRTVMPDVALQDVTEWALLGGTQGTTETELTRFASAADASISIGAGTWNFTLLGYKESAVILQGSITGQYISSSEMNTLNFTVAPVEDDGEGTLSLTVELPAGSGITEARVFKDGQLHTTIAPVDDKVVFEGTNGAGIYYFSIRLYKGDDLYGAVSEVVYVWANLSSENTYTLTNEDLNLTYIITYHLWDGETDTGYYRYTDTVTLITSSRPDYAFKGWYEDADYSGDAVSTIPAGSEGDKDFYAQWGAVEQVSSDTLADALAWISANAEENGAYSITINADGAIEPQTLSYSGKNVNIIINGGDAERVISLSATGALFTVESGVTLTLGNNVTLQGRSDNTAALVQVNSGGTLVTNDGSKLIGNTTSSNGGGVLVSGGTWTMNGGEISGNTASSGGGVYVDGGTWTMSGGEISGNTASYSGYGGGVYVSSGTFTKQSGGTIYGSNAGEGLKNTAANGDSYGHAVYAGSDSKVRNTTAGVGVTLNSAASGAEDGWEVVLPSNLSLVESLAWISANVEEGGNYTIILSANESIGPQTLSYSGKNVSITLNGGAAERTVSLSSSGSLFRVESGVTLTLGNNVTLQGYSGNTTSLVYVGNGALVMNDGSKLSGNTNSSNPTYGGGVYVYGGTFTMNGGEISGNTNSYSSSAEVYGGGVSVRNSGTFTMSGGTISGNAATAYYYPSYGGGVSVYSGTFEMSGGTISGNAAYAYDYNGYGYSAYGGGVYVSSSSGTFTMSGGTISDNTADAASNYAYAYGGGVSNDGTFTMSDGTISGNTVSYYYSSYPAYGGGVYSNGTFTKQGGTIYGSDASDSLKNTTASGDSYGHAVYVSSSQKRNITVDTDSALDSSVSGSAGGWVDPMPSNSLAQALSWLSSNAEAGGAYTITLNADESIAPQSLSYSGNNVSITLDGGDAERTVSLSSSGSLFTIESGVTLTLGNNVTLQGRSGNTDSLVYVNSSGALVMNDGSKITGNATSTSYGTSGGGVFVNGGTWTMNGGTVSGNRATYYGGGVYVSSGTFTMSGGEISGNTAYYYDGGGVYVGNSGTFTMEGGEISGNTATVASSNYGGGGVYSNGTFTMNGGEISNNTASSSVSGGGVCIGSGTFTMNGGEISGNTASSSGGGVYVYSGTFTMSDGAISGNTASYGGGVYVRSSGTFTMEDGEISGNTASSSAADSYGGGVYVGSGTFTMKDGEISNNTASTTSTSYSAYGGGVYVGSSGTFTMEDGEISGNTASSSAASAYGGGVYVYSSGTFTMSGGAISGNTASASGGGVYVSSSSGTFTKQDGTIYGSNASEDLKNTASNGAGHAVYAGSAKRRNSTADAGVNLDSSVSGGAGGWEMGSVQISLQAATSDPQLSNASLSVNESSSFSVGSGYSSYTWYWDGAVIAGATSYSYNMGAYSKTPGIYELSVVAITSTGEMLSARCRVVVKAK